MDAQTARTIGSTPTLEGLRQLEANARERNRLTDEIKAAIRERTKVLGRAFVAERTGLDLSHLTPAEEKIVEAASEYVGIKRREGKPANRTLSQLQNQGLIGAAEVSVAKSKPTQGFATLADADLEDLSYEQIIVDHPEEFSPRALWYARRTLGLPNDSDKPPAKSESLTQLRTAAILTWLRKRAESSNGNLTAIRNADIADALEIGDMHKYGRVLGNLQSRIDFACYRTDLPPLGLALESPFPDAWATDGRDWDFPVSDMQKAARSHRWRSSDFDRILAATKELSGQAHISWKKEINSHEDRLRSWAFNLKENDETENSSETELEAEANSETDAEVSASSGRRGPDWTRTELILALDLYLRFRRSPRGETSEEIAELSALLGRIGDPALVARYPTYRNANGVYMKMMNFRRFDPEFMNEGKVGLPRGNKLEEAVWREFADKPLELANAVAEIKAEVEPRHSHEFGDREDDTASTLETPYWVFVCNPKKWAIDRFLDRRVEHDSWGIRPSDRSRFAPGQLGIVRVGVDRRSIAERNGGPELEAGIYALCEVESAAYDGTGASDEFWSPGEAREPGWPTIKLKYLRTFLDTPLTITKLRAEAPNISHLLLNGFQAASFPISEEDFYRVLDLLKVDRDQLAEPAEAKDVTADKLADLEKKYLNACPETKERLSRTIERGEIGSLIKRANGYKCQVCEALGKNPVGFLKRNGEPYVEAHHVMPVSKRAVGSLTAANVMTLCANHHRQMHYGNIDVEITPECFEFSKDETQLSICRFALNSSNRERERHGEETEPQYAFA